MRACHEVSLRRSHSDGKKSCVSKINPDPNKSFDELFETRLSELSGWRAETLAGVRSVIVGASSTVKEEWKWNVPVWSSSGIICTGEAYKAAVKLTFAHGASIPDPANLFNSSLEGKVRRAIDIREGVPVDKKALSSLIRAAIAFNDGRKK